MRTIPIGGCVLRVIVGRERVARRRSRLSHRPNSVEARLAGFEKNASIEAWIDALMAGAYVFIPELDLSAPFRIPRGVEVDQDVEPPVDFHVFVEVEIDMHIEPPT